MSKLKSLTFDTYKVAAKATLDEALLRQALEAIEERHVGALRDRAIAALRERLGVSK